MIIFGWVKKRLQEKRERSRKREFVIAETKRGIRDIEYKLDTNHTLSIGIRTTYAMSLMQLEGRLEKLEQYNWYVDLLEEAK